MNLKFDIKGITDLEMKLSKLEKGTAGVAKLCLYEGAKVVADNLRAAVSTIPTEAHHAVPHARNGRPLVYMTPEEKAACLEGIGIAHFDGSDDNFTTAIGFDGYQDITCNDGKYRDVSVPMLMRALESGTSVRQKYPVCRKAFQGSESGAFSAMSAKFAELTGKMFN